jgi:hypothetical protein
MDALTDIRKTEATIRQTEAEVRQELADLERKVDTSAADDRAAYAEALASGAAVPKATSARIKDRITDIKMRVLPGTDEALWTLVPKVREAVNPDVKEQYLTQNLRRWNPPDPGRRDQPSPTTHLQHRPMSVVDWVLSRIAAVEASEAEQAVKDDKQARKEAATLAVNRAQSEHNLAQRAKLDAEEEGMSPAAVTSRRLSESRSQPWPEFDRRRWLEEHDMLADYGWTMGGGVIIRNAHERVIRDPADSKEATSA